MRLASMNLTAVERSAATRGSSSATSNVMALCSPSCTDALFFDGIACTSGALLLKIFAYLSFKVAAGGRSKPAAGIQRPQQRKSSTMTAPIKQSRGRTHVASATQSS